MVGNGPMEELLSPHLGGVVETDRRRRALIDPIRREPLTCAASGLAATIGPLPTSCDSERRGRLFLVVLAYLTAGA